jgi:hypothetical protein
VTKPPFVVEWSGAAGPAIAVVADTIANANAAAIGLMGFISKILRVGNGKKVWRSRLFDAPLYSLLLAGNGHLLGGLIARHEGLVADHNHRFVGWTGLYYRALLVRTADDVVLGRERRSGCTEKKSDGQDVLEHVGSPCFVLPQNNAPDSPQFLTRTKVFIDWICSEYPFIPEINIPLQSVTALRLPCST